jgi:hypothetical protein
MNREDKMLAVSVLIAETKKDCAEFEIQMAETQQHLSRLKPADDHYEENKRGMERYLFTVATELRAEKAKLRNLTAHLARIRFEKD